MIIIILDFEYYYFFSYSKIKVIIIIINNISKFYKVSAKIDKFKKGEILKSLKPILIIIGIISIIITVFLTLAKKQNMVTIKKGNISHQPIDIKLHHYQDSQCGMVIDTIKYSSEVISPDGRTWFFHDHGGMIKWLEDKKFKNSATIWVHAIDTNRWIDGKKAHYTRDENTPMKYGFGAYENSKNGTISFDEMRLLTLRGETMVNPIIRKELLKKRENGNH